MSISSRFKKKTKNKRTQIIQRTLKHKIVKARKIKINILFQTIQYKQTNKQNTCQNIVPMHGIDSFDEK